MVLISHYHDTSLGCNSYGTHHSFPRVYIRFASTHGRFIPNHTVDYSLGDFDLYPTVLDQPVHYCLDKRELAPYLRLPDDTVFSFTTNPIYEWIGLQNNRQVGGVVPASQPQGTVDIILYVQTTNKRTYTVTFTALIVPYTEPSPPPTSATSTATDDLSSTTTTPSTTQTRPTAFPTPTIYQGMSFNIGKDPYQWALGDILNGVSSDPPADWFKLVLPPLFRPSGITGVVPADWPPGPINVTLDLYSRSPSMQYFVTFVVIVMESPPVSTTSAA
ncbi:hypothetical protein UCDDA912_g10742 [Diaporthe ampelina]|uniref:Uncharacterized protein n=1 Tax=Diaporthe ampelina TaxID=1214573 RepID=A0A0G2HM45_9PEZI|nr:hypothetical protein UCDDA912_g10742 [Diaporthe ampelina]